MSTAQVLPRGETSLPYGDPVLAPPLRLVPTQPLDFDGAVRRVRPRLHRYAVRRLGDTHEAEELVQEALLRAYTHREKLLTEDDLAAWTTVVTGRLVIDRLRVRGRSTSFADVPEGSLVGRDTADVVVARDEARIALDAIDAMPPRQAALLWAREVEGRSYQDLCERFGMTEPAVRSILTRARKSLRTEYALRGGTLPVGGLAVLAPWIAGLGWAAKLRRAATRITAPAVLGAVGVTALGGLILSPFGVGHGPDVSSYNPAQAVVSTPHRATVKTVPHGSRVPAWASSSRLGAGGGGAMAEGRPGSPKATPARAISRFNCQGDAGAGVNTVVRAVASRVTGINCQTAEGNEIVVTLNPAGLPNPTNVNVVSIQDGAVPCPPLPANPLVSCHTQQGAQQ